MPWQSLSATLGTRPHVLAGPLLRKVTAREVTVWFALRKACTITLRVLQGNNVILTGSRSTVAVGVNLHIVAVTADTLAPPHSGLSEGVIYEYDATLDFGGLQHTLSSATGNAPLAYAPFSRPSFCLPPADVNRLRLIHGSCRIPHGNGPDALALLDGLIAQGASNPSARPHQLMLTGDQIYADDVGYAMSMMLSDAGEALLGWSEEVSVKFMNQPARTIRVADLSLAGREIGLMFDAGFTSVDLVCQLIGLGEYFAMYLFVWSDALWPSPAADLPTYDQIVARFRATEQLGDPGFGRRIDQLDRVDIEKQTARTLDFRNTVPQVRRALANIPGYMIFDDHEITDDWNMTRLICQTMYNSDLGLRVVQNGLTAYALCQHWGNVPDQFDTRRAPLPPGAKLQLALDGINATTHASAGPTLRHLLGVHEHAVLATRRPYSVFHDADALNYHYTVEGPGHQIIVTDTRTWRSFSGGAHDGGELLPAAEIQKQIVNTPATGDRALLVVLTTNAPPVEPIRVTARHPVVTRKVALQFEGDGSPDIYEAWELPAKATDRLYKAISEKLPLVSLPFAGTVRRGHAILLSGDVHTSFASRLLFNATARFEDPQANPQPVSAVYAQLVASSFRKQTGNTIGQHRDGYTYAPKWIVKKLLIPDHVPEGYLGWNLPSGTKKVVGQIVAHAGTTVGTSDIKLKGPGTVALTPKAPGLFTSITTPVDYTYRLDYLLAVVQGVLPPTPPPLPPMPTGTGAEDRKRAAAIYNAATGSYRTFNASNKTRREIVGVNNLAEITFDWFANGDRFVLHTLRWFDDILHSLTFTTYVVSLNPDDPLFPELRP